MTFNTGNPIGSTDARDRLDNTENMDYLENSTTELTHPDRLGTVRKTRHGMEVEHDNQISAHELENDNQVLAHQIEHDNQISAHEVEHDAQISAHESEFDIKMAGMAFSRVGTFAAGFTLADARQTLLYATDGHDYGWAGAFPKVVTAGSTPATSGGIGAGAWVDRTDVTLRDEVRETTFQTMKRSYAEAGFNLVDGSFQMGGSLSGWPDVLWDWATGVAYQWHYDEAKTIPSGSTPATSGGIGAGAWVDRTDLTLRSELISQDGSSKVGFKQAGAGAVTTNVQNKLREFVSAKDYPSIQDAIDEGHKVIDLGGPDDVYELSAPVVMLVGQTLNANLATVRATTTMDSLIIGANNCTVSGVVLDCNNSQGTNGAQSDGAHNGIDLSDTVGARIFSNRFTKYRHGICLYSTGTTVAGKALIYGNEFDAGYEWSSSKPDNFQLGIYAGSTLSAASTNILNFDALRPESAHCAQIIIVGNRFNRGQYGVALHRASNCTVTGNNFSRMSRAVSLQQQSTDVNVTGNSFTELLSTGVHMAYGTRGIAVSGNSFNGTMANDNSFVQAYYGVSDITITGNKFDSKFGDYDGGGYGLTDTRRAGNGVRIGQQAENITVANNTFRGFFAAIRVQSTIYETTITPADVNYYNSGFRKIKITGNIIIGDYYVPVATGYKLQMTNTQTYGVYLFVSGGWEDTTLGGWDVEDVLVSDNTVDGVLLGYAIQQTTMTSSNPVAFRDRSVKMSDNYARNITAQEYILTGYANPQAPMVMRNSWNPSVTWASAPPMVGTHKRGDIVYSTAPSASGNIGWVCTAAGTPGIWKTYGAISS